MIETEQGAAATVQKFLVIIACLVLAGCSANNKGDEKDAGNPVVDYGLLQTLPDEPISFSDAVQPILEKRCIVCHGCYDAPCQLKLSSHEGIVRGANPEKVYNGGRFEAMAPSRLGIDEKTTEAWRARAFTPVLNEPSDPATATPEENLENSVLYLMLRQKQLYPQPRTSRLPPTFDLALDREQTCPSPETFDQFAEQHPRWGMPYAMPNLEEDEYATLVQWIAQGAPDSPAVSPSAAAAEQIEQWEAFLNEGSNKQQLVSRYLYEHLFLAHLHFAGTDDREFYRLVRSSTPPGQPIDEIATAQPFGDPGDTFYYRVQHYTASIVDKDHIVYEWSPERMARYRELFLAPEYEVTTMPTYDPTIASNPFAIFSPIPPNSRYRFMLDDARFFINGFIKGPVCRGQVALNVIEDHFWVTFIAPDKDVFTEDPEFLDAAAAHLVTPSESVSSLNLLSIFTRYWKSQKNYLAAKEAFIEKIEPMDINTALDFMWDGDGNNPNAALTVFRHFDSATVEYGLLGDYPESAWFIDYPLLERIHYLLVAGFDVFGNLGHQLNTRLYMDFLRMEGEDQFLLLIPAEKRAAIRQSWYTGVRESRKRLQEEPHAWINQEIVTGYKTDDPQQELYWRIEAHMGDLAAPKDSLNRCPLQSCEGQKNFDAIDQAMQQITQIRGEHLRVFPDTALVQVTDESDAGGRAYTLILNKGYKNLTSLFSNEDNRDLEYDTLTVLRGVSGAYPNFFFTVPADEIQIFIDGMRKVRNRQDYEKVVALYGIRRTNPAFWATADWFQDTVAVERPREAGILDLNRYRNR